MQTYQLFLGESHDFFLIFFILFFYLFLLLHEKYHRRVSQFIREEIREIPPKQNTVIFCMVLGRKKCSQVCKVLQSRISKSKLTRSTAS